MVSHLLLSKNVYVTNDILCTLIRLFNTSVGEVCWILRPGHIQRLTALSWVPTLNFIMTTLTFSSSFRCLSSASSSPSTSLPFPCYAYSQISLLSLHSRASSPFFIPGVKFTGSSPSLHNSWAYLRLHPQHSRTFLSHIWDKKWTLSTNHKATQVSRGTELSSQIQPLFIIYDSYSL